MILKYFIAGYFKENCYIVGDEDTKEVAIIDPGGNKDKILKIIKGNGYKVPYIILTHGHFDHLSAVKEIKKEIQCKVIVHEDDAECLVNSDKNLSALLGFNSIQVPADIKVKNGDKINVGKYEFEVIHTPGHSPGSICLKTDKTLFSGDTIFKGFVGRTDLVGGNQEKLIQSINQKIKPLDDDIIVYPGHGSSTTIKDEKLSNAYLK